MNVASLKAVQYQEAAQNKGLRQAAVEAGPPSLTDDESKMIRREFSDAKPVTYYKGNGEKQQQMISGRGRHLDTTV